MKAKELGRFGEDQAKLYLEGKGYLLVERNFRCRWGEIDLIMLDRGQLVFIEVKARASFRFGRPEEAIGSQKIRRMRRLVGFYLAQHSSPSHWGLRLDAVAVDVEGASGRVLDIRHYCNIG